MKELNARERSAKRNAESWEPVTVAGTKEIIAIAEAFRALENRAEAAEALADLRGKNVLETKAMLDAAEAKLKELDKQEPFAYCITDKEDRLSSNKGKLNFHSIERYSAEDINEYELSAMPLFARAALPIAAIRLPDDVPDLMNLSPEQQTEFNRGFWYGVEKVKRLNATATAISLVDLVPDEMTLDSDTGTVTESGHVQAVKGWNACRAAILRNIEEQSQ